jgi:hypothetical protein
VQFFTSYLSGGLVASNLLAHHDNGGYELLCNPTAPIPDHNKSHLIAFKITIMITKSVVNNSISHVLLFALGTTIPFHIAAQVL